MTMTISNDSRSHRYDASPLLLVALLALILAS